MMRYCFALIFALVSGQLFAQYGHVDHWETALFTSEPWRYHEGTVAPDSNWKSPFYNDSGWKTGGGGLGFGYSNLNTVVNKAPSLYIRKVFTIKDTSKLQAAVLSSDWDDGFVAYLNGFEVAREAIGSPWVEPAHNEYADYERKAKLVNNEPYNDFLIRKNELKRSLRDGDNVLAIQIHNVSAVSPDLAAFFNLHFGMTDTGQQFAPAPTWFTIPPVFADSSTLPVIKITSFPLNDSAKVSGKMEITWNGYGKRNSFYGEANHFNGNILVKYRGNSTLQFPKKSMTVETVHSDSTPRDVSLLGMPRDNDWILYAPYSDKSLLRNVVSYSLARRMQEYATRTQLVELYHNGYYIGVYVFMEKIKRGDYRVDINNLDYTDTNDRSITGGYIMKADWDNDTNWNAFHLPHDKKYGDFEENTFQWYRPKPDSLHDKQKKYSRDFVWEFEEVLLSDTFNRNLAYSKYININSFIDYTLMREISKEIDGYRYSVYFYKDHQEDGDRLHMGPVWDFNLGYGNVDFSTSGAEKTDGWLYEVERGRIFWFKRLLDDPFYQNRMDCRWKVFRQRYASDQQIVEIIDDAVAEMDSAANRNHYIWKSIGRYIWPNNFVGESYEEEIVYLKSWIRNRTRWMDANIPGTCNWVGVEEGVEIVTDPGIEVYPNPTNTHFNVRASGSSLESVSVWTITGQLVYSRDVEELKEIQIDVETWNPGIYLTRANDAKGRIFTAKISVQ